MNVAVTESQVRLGIAGQSIRAILVHVQPDPSARPRLQAAVALAKALGARLVGVAAEQLNVSAVSGDAYGYSTGPFVAELLKLVSDNLERAGAVFEEAAAQVEHEFHAMQADPNAALCQMAAKADLIVAGGAPTENADPLRTCDAAELAMRSGLPVLVVPRDGGVLSGKSILVAWKNTREARRALRDAMPFLAAAEQVTVAEACFPEEVADAEGRLRDVVGALRGHGIAASATAIPGVHDDVVPHLQEAANDAGADLIVCGAYGHTRFGEWLFGGVTRDLLENPRRFILLSH